MTEQRKCKKCLETKDINNFPVRKRNGIATSHRHECKSCQKKYLSDWHDLHPEYKNKRKRARVKIHETRSDYLKYYREKNRDRRAAYAKTYNAQRKRRKPEYFAEKEARRNSAKIKATPPWLTSSHILEMKNVYLHARDCYLTSGESYHVDHIVPLVSKSVCGLHVPWNLQILPSDLNISKKNKFNEWWK